MTEQQEFSKKLDSLYQKRVDILENLKNSSQQIRDDNFLRTEIERLVEEDSVEFSFGLSVHQLEQAKCDYRRKLMSIINTRESEVTFKHRKPISLNSKKIVGLIASIFLGITLIYSMNIAYKAFFPAKDPAIVAPVNFTTEGTLSTIKDGNYGIITVSLETQASSIYLYEGGNKIASINESKTLRKKVFHEKGVYVYFAEIYFGDKLFKTDEISVTY